MTTTKIALALARARWIAEFLAAHGYGPSLSDCAEGWGIKKGAAGLSVRRMRRLSLVHYRPEHRRSITPLLPRPGGRRLAFFRAQNVESEWGARTTEFRLVARARRPRGWPGPSAGPGR